MKNLKTLLLTTAVALTLNVNAHDPSMHAKKAPAKADCSGYLKMVESGTKMDMSDPVMMAMMKKCKNQKPATESKCGDMSDGHHDDKKGESKCGDMSDDHHDKKTEMKCGDMKNADAMKKGESKCGDTKAVVEKVKSEMKCGGDMKKTAKKAKEKVEEHGKHDH